MFNELRFDSTFIESIVATPWPITSREISEADGSDISITGLGQFAINCAGAYCLHIWASGSVINSYLRARAIFYDEDMNVCGATGLYDLAVSTSCQANGLYYSAPVILVEIGSARFAAVQIEWLTGSDWTVFLRPYYPGEGKFF